jgi:iron complex transport system permease protein
MSRSYLLPLLLVAGLAAIAGATAIGPSAIGPGEAFRALLAGPPSGPDAPAAAVIVWELRLPRAVLAWIVGAALAFSGAIFQGLFRNPLADPFVIGVSGGASVGAVAAIAAGASVSFLGLDTVPLFAFAGGVAAVALVYALGRSGGRASMDTLLLAGLAVGAFCASLTTLLLWLNAGGIAEMILWLMGHRDAARWSHVGAALPYAAIAGALGLAYARDLNALSLGEEQAQQLGVNVARSRKALLAAGTLAAAAAVAVSGLIGFVGLIVPNALRQLTGADHRRLLPASALAGGAFLVMADAAARALPPSGLPLGIVTGLCGGPFFLYILHRGKRASAGTPS